MFVGVPKNYVLRIHFIDFLLVVCYNHQILRLKGFIMDNVDLKLIQELQKDGRLTHVDLARKLGVVEGTIRGRIKQLVGKKIIKIMAIPNLRELGYNMISIIGIQVIMAELRGIADLLSKKRNVCYLAFIAGRYDLIAFVVARSPEELSQFIEKEISAIPGIVRTETFVNLDVIKGMSGIIDTSDLINELSIASSKGRAKRQKT